VSEFPSGSELTGIMEEAGLINTSFCKMTGGIATVYIGNKPEHP
jgi:ubiquinone/menaquinone biosynthesis C-methylase UbiE